MRIFEQIFLPMNTSSKYHNYFFDYFSFAPSLNALPTFSPSFK